MINTDYLEVKVTSCQGQATGRTERKFTLLLLSMHDPTLDRVNRDDVLLLVLFGQLPFEVKVKLARVDHKQVSDCLFVDFNLKIILVTK